MDPSVLDDLVKQFRSDLVSQPAEDVVRKYVFEGNPYVFREKPEALKLLKDHLCANLPLCDKNVVIVGSAQTGFSLHPDKFPRRFHDGSDIDVLIVDESLFDAVWSTILEWHYPRRRVGLPAADMRWAKDRSDELYWGWFVPDRIRFEGLSLPTSLRRLRDISTQWFNAFQSLGQYAEFATRDVSGRLYRSWNHAMLYHKAGLDLLRDRITQ